MKTRYWPLTPNVCRKAAQLIANGVVDRSCIALGDSVAQGLMLAADDAASALLAEQKHGTYNPAGILRINKERQATTRVMYLELLALAMEDKLL